MIRILTLYICLLLASYQVNAQSSALELSDAFKEPDKLGAHLLQCDNGNTFLFNYVKKLGIELTIYGKDRHQSEQRVMSSKVWDPTDINNIIIHDIYERNNSVVMFIEQKEKRSSSLYRILLDTEHGTILAEEKLADLPVHNQTYIHTNGYVYVTPPAFYVRRDPKTGDYAVAIFNTYANETENRVEVISYNQQHKQKARSLYQLKDRNFKFIDFQSMIVVNGQVYLCTLGYEADGPDKNTASLFLSTLRDGSTTMEGHMLTGTQKFDKETYSILKYNEGSKSLNFLTFTKIAEKYNGAFKTFKLLYGGFNPSTLSITYLKQVDATKAADYSEKYFGKRQDITGMPMGMIVNYDNSVSVFLQQESTHNGRSTGLPASGDVVILNMDLNGNVAEASMLRMLHRNGRPTPLALSEVRNRYSNLFSAGAALESSKVFWSFDYLSTRKGNYILYNDDLRNFTRDLNETPFVVNAVSESDFMLAKLDGTGLKKSLPFGQPDDQFDGRFALLSSGHYNETLNKYAVIAMERQGRKKVARIAWIDLN